MRHENSDPHVREAVGYMSPSRGNCNAGFTLVELLAVTAIILILSSLLMSAIRGVRLRARVVKVHAELKSLSEGLMIYYNGWERYPPAHKPCGVEGEHSNKYPPEALEQRCVDMIPKDIFNDGPTYKYVAPGPGRWNNAPTVVDIWVPRNYPDYQGERYNWNSDRRYSSQEKSPVKWALWSVGPFSQVRWYDVDNEHLPVPKRSWYRRGNPRESRKSVGIGIITRLSNGRISP